MCSLGCFQVIRAPKNVKEYGNYCFLNYFLLGKLLK